MKSVLRNAGIPFLVMALSVASCGSSINPKNWSDAGPVTVETSSIPGINGICTSAVKVEYIPSDSQKIVVTAPEKIHELLEIKVTDSVLNISLEGSIGSSFIRSGNNLSRTVVRVYAKGVKNFDLTAGSSVAVASPVTITDMLKVSASSGASFDAPSVTAPDVRLVASSGASIEVSALAKSLWADASSGSSIEVEGKAEMVKLSSSSGASLDAEDLAAATGSASASSGSSIECNIAAPASVSSNSGASISNRKNK